MSGRPGGDGDERKRRRRPGWSVWALLGVALGLTLPLVLAGFMRGRGAHDQLNFHEKVVRTFAHQWPNPDVGNYLSATTPGYHLVLGAAAAAGLDSLTGLRALGSTFTLALLALLAGHVSRRLREGEALAVCLPLACSLYVVQSGAWLLPDNAGWLGVLAVLALALRPRFDAWTVLGGGAALAALVCVRQSHLWAAAPLWVAAWAGRGDGALGAASPPARRGARALADPDRIARGAVMLAATLPAFLIVAWFVRVWGGLTPPRFHELYLGQGPKAGPIPSPAAPAFFLSIFGVASLFFAGHFGPALGRLWTRRRGRLLAAGAGGLVLALLPPTTYDAPNRSSGLWNAARVLPEIAGHTSPVFLVLAPLGAVALAAWSAAVRARSRTVLLAGAAGFVAAQAASLQLWQRYTEPFVLMLLALLAAEAGGAAPPAGAAPGRAAVRGARAAGPAALAALLLAVAAAEVLRGRPATDRHITLDPATTIPAPPRP